MTLSIDSALKELMTIEGALGAALVDYSSGMTLGDVCVTKDLDLAVAAAGNTEVVRAKQKTMNALGLKDRIEDILITLGEQYHVIRPLASRDGLFLYLALHRANANLAMARFKLADIEKSLTV